MIGPAAVVSEPVDAEPAEVVEPPPGKSTGHVVQGLNFHVWSEDSREATDWALELLQAGGKTLELARWRSIAAKRAVLPSILTDEIEAELATWSEGPSGNRGISPLGCMLCLLPSLDRTALISSWATSSNEQTRRAVARALSAPFEAVGVRGAIDHLQADPSSQVRRLARNAVAIRRASLG
jgi:hypothetical protein